MAERSPTKRKTRTPAQRATDLLTTYLGQKQLQTLDIPDEELLAGVRAAVAYNQRAKLAA